MLVPRKSRNALSTTEHCINHNRIGQGGMTTRPSCQKGCGLVDVGWESRVGLEPRMQVLLEGMVISNHFQSFKNVEQRHCNEL